jgi:hypothetical protein
MKNIFTKLLLLEISSRCGFIGWYKKYKTMKKEIIEFYAELSYENYCKYITNKENIESVDVKTIYLIEKGFIDSMENRKADWYEPYGYKLTEQEASEFCDSFGFYTEKDCWSIAYHPDKIMPKYRYKEIKLI